MKKLLPSVIVLGILLLFTIWQKFIWTPKDIKVIPVEIWNKLNNLPPSKTPLISPNDYIDLPLNIKG